MDSVIDKKESSNLKSLLRTLNIQEYYDWILYHKSHTKTVNGKIVSLDLSWLALRNLPEAFLKILPNLRSIRLDNNPNCDFDPGCFDHPNLREIKLRYCNLLKVPIHGFGIGNELRVLDICNNKISSIKRGDLKNLRNLRTLNVAHNSIDSVNSRSFQGLIELEEIHLEYNNLISIPEFTFDGLKNLQYLYLHNNSIDILESNSFFGLHQLQDLKLDSNKILKLPKGIFYHSPQLQILSLFNNRLTKLGSELNNLPNLTKLCLDTNLIENLAISTFKNTNNITVLELQSNLLKQIEPKTFANMDNLEIVDVSDNPLSFEAALNLPASALFNYTPMLQQLSSDNLHDILIEHYENVHLVNLAKKSGKLHEKTLAFLRLSGN